MNDSLYIAATGMHMQQKSVDTIANNMANVNTPGYKRGRVSFEDMVYRDLGGASAVAGAPGAQRPWQGSGVAVSSILKSFVAGEIKQTGQRMDLAIQGEGFIEVVAGDGTSAYTRGGALVIDKEGFLASACPPSMSAPTPGKSRSKRTGASWCARATSPAWSRPDASNWCASPTPQA